MLGLAHRGYRLADYDHHLVHTLRDAGYTSDADRRAARLRRPARHRLRPRRRDRLHQRERGRARPPARDPARRPTRAVLPLRRLLRDPPRLLRADLGARRAVLAAARQPARTRRRRAATWRPTRPARARSTRASAPCSTRSSDGEHARDLHHRPRARVPGRQGDADRPRDRRAADHARARAASTAAGCPTRSSPRSTSSRRSASSPGIERPEWVRGGRCCRCCARRPTRSTTRCLRRSRSTPPTSRSARCARGATSTSGASTTATRARCSPTSTTAPARTTCSPTGWPSATRPRRSSTTSSSIPTRRTTSSTTRATRSRAELRARLQALDGGDRRPAARRPGRARCRARRSTTPAQRSPSEPDDEGLMPHGDRPPDAGRRPGRAARRAGRASAASRSTSCASTATSAYPDPRDPDFVVALGSGATRRRRRARSGWSDEIEWLRAADAAALPVLGICFGAQALAAALGGCVRRLREARARLGHGRHRRRRPRAVRPVDGLARGPLHAAAAGLRARAQRVRRAGLLPLPAPRGPVPPRGHARDRRATGRSTTTATSSARASRREALDDGHRRHAAAAARAAESCSTASPPAPGSWL